MDVLHVALRVGEAKLIISLLEERGDTDFAERKKITCTQSALRAIRKGLAQKRAVKW